MIARKNRATWRAGRIDSFRFALRGIKVVLRSQRNFKIHVMASIAVVIAGFIFRLSATEWSILVLTIAMVLSLEAFNTAMEHFVDHVSPEYHDTAGKVKDISAGAVLISAIAAAVIGIIIFGSRIYYYLNVN